MDSPAGGVVREVAQPKAFHDDTLTSERSIPVELHAHDPIAEFAIFGRRPQERVLFRSGLSKSHGIHRLCS